ncbi:MAG: RIP metalloprotease RseP [Candidatus Cloacimonetes bacterium]|nr:RIP metalloprotease RseP [Candidatus Cloacimonadota bacterium]
MIIKTIISLGILVFVHELGHLIAALLMKVKVEKFSIGFGPKLFSFTWKEIEFKISLIPLGGYLKMKGENPDEKLSNDSYDFQNKKWWQKIFIAFSGPFANLIFAFFVFVAAFLLGRVYYDQLPVLGKITDSYQTQFLEGDRFLEVNGTEVKSWTAIIRNIRQGENNFKIEREHSVLSITTDNLSKDIFYSNLLPQAPAIIGDVSPGLPAYKAGLLSGDEILEIDNTPVKDWYELRDIITRKESDKITVKLLRDSKLYSIEIELQNNLFDNNSKMIGITQKLPHKIEENYSLTKSLLYGSYSTITSVWANYYGLYKLFLNPSELSKNVSSPIMLYSIAKSTSTRGISDYLDFLAAISIVLMVMNLLPIPVLDGGLILFSLIEGIIRKPLSFKFKLAAQNVGILILFTLMVFAFSNDIGTLIKRNRAFKQNTELNQE